MQQSTAPTLPMRRVFALLLSRLENKDNEEHTIPSSHLILWWLTIINLDHHDEASHHCPSMLALASCATTSILTTNS
jgi:hypothetical protein